MSFRTCFPGVALVALMTTAPASGLEFTEVARLNVDFAFAANIGEQDPPDVDNNPKYIGTNPLGIAWDGSKMYLAGFDNSGGSFLPIGLIEVLNPASFTGDATLNDADFSDAFGQVFQPPGRGYTGIDLQGDRLAASYDEGFGTANGIQVFDTTDNSLIWDLGTNGLTGRGGSGVAFDPGFPGGNAATGAGVAWTSFGSGRRALNDTETGAEIWQLDDAIPETLGMQWLTDAAPAGNFARDIAFDPATGDVYTRRSNDLDAADRTGDNATDNRRTLVDNGSNGDFIIGQKLGFLGDVESNGSTDDFLIYNDSPSSSLGQAFEDVIKVINTQGVETTPTFNLLNGETVVDLGTGNGVYDFAFDAASGTLALLDFTNRNVHLLQIGAVAPGLAADFNDDGTVNQLDLDILSANYGLPGGSTTGDANGDGTVNLLDLDLLGEQFGMSSATAVSVPEPATALFAVLAIGLAGSRRQR